MLVQEFFVLLFTFYCTYAEAIADYRALLLIFLNITVVTLIGVRILRTHFCIFRFTVLTCDSCAVDNHLVHQCLVLYRQPGGLTDGVNCGWLYSAGSPQFLVDVHDCCSAHVSFGDFRLGINPVLEFDFLTLYSE